MTAAELVLREVEMDAGGVTVRGTVRLATETHVWVQVWCGGCDRPGCGNAHASWFTRTPDQVRMVDA